MFDALTIAAVADELTEHALEARIQKVGLIDRQTLAAELYVPGQRYWLVASSDAQRARVYLASRPPSTDPELVTPFGLLLRKYVRGGILIGVDQPPLERLIRLSIAKRLSSLNAHDPDIGAGDRAASPDVLEDQNVPAALDDEIETENEGTGEAELSYVHLVVEVMGRHSNVMLLDDTGRVMEATKHVTRAMSRVRPIRPGVIYTPPPPQDKPDPRRLTAAMLAEMVRGAERDDDLARLLVSHLRGVSPQMAREVVFRGTGATTMAAGAVSEDQIRDVAREMRGLLEPLLTSAWVPAVYRRDERVVAFAAHPLYHLRASTEEIMVPSISAAIEMAEEAAGGPQQRHAQRRQRLADSIRSAIKRLEARQASLREQEMKSREAETFRQWGELIYAYLWQIQPGQRELTVDGVTIPLDPSLSPKENAQAYFERYRKAQGATKQLPELEERTEAQLAYLTQLLTMVDQARTFAEIEAIALEWESESAELGLAGGTMRQSQGGERRATKGGATKRPAALYDRHGNAIFVGHSGSQNELVTFEIARPDDTWLHARGVPGSHVIIRWANPRGPEDPETIETAASLAAYYSAARGSVSVEVDVTRRRYVRKIKGAGPGMVTYRQERTIAVPPRSEDQLRDVVSPAAQKVAEGNAVVTD